MATVGARVRIAGCDAELMYCDNAVMSEAAFAAQRWHTLPLARVTWVLAMTVRTPSGEMQQLRVVPLRRAAGAKLLLRRLSAQQEMDCATGQPLVTPEVFVAQRGATNRTAAGECVVSDDLHFESIDGLRARLSNPCHFLQLCP